MLFAQRYAHTAASRFAKIGPSAAEALFARSVAILDVFVSPHVAVGLLARAWMPA